MFGQHLKKLINNAGIKQIEIAKQLKIPQSTLNSWIRGISHPRFLQIKPLCRILDIEIEELFDYDE